MCLRAKVSDGFSLLNCSKPRKTSYENCNSCGKCCVKYSNGGLSASSADLKIWESLRPYIHQYVNREKIWVGPKTRQRLALCPWLRQESPSSAYTCAIYADRPEDCRVYPANISDMIKDGCEMLEPKDHLNIKQAQIELERLKSL